MGQNVGRNSTGPLKSGIITNMEDYGDKMSNTELTANVSLLFIMEHQSPPLSYRIRSGRGW